MFFDMRSRVFTKNNVRRLAIFLLGVSMPFNQIKVAGFTVSVLCMLLYFATMLSSIHYFRRLTSIYGKKILLPVLFYCILIFINLFHIDNPYGIPFINTSIFLCLLFYYFLLIHQTIDNKSLRWALSGVAIGAIAISVFFIWGIGVSFNSGGRVVVFEENANTVGVFQCIGAIIILNEFILKDSCNLRIFRFLWVIAFVPMIALMIACGSRTAFIIFTLSFLLSIILFPTKKRYGKFVVFVVGMGIAIYGFSSFLSEESLLLERLQSTTDEGDSGGRVELSLQLLHSVLDHPILGVGETGYTEVSQKYLNFVLNENGVIRGYSPHNVFLEVLIYTGITGFIVMMIFWFWSFKNAWMKYKIFKDVLPLLLAIPTFACLLTSQLLSVKWGYLMYAFFLIPYNRNIIKKRYNEQTGICQ